MKIKWHEWVISDTDNLTLLKIYQIPLKIAYALTIHRSQGQSLDFVDIDLSNTFCNGQSYVALSRCRTLEGLSIKNKINFDKIKVNQKALDFYKKIEEEEKIEEEKIEVVYTDGSTSNNGKIHSVGGCGVWFAHNNQRNISEKYNFDLPATNQKCELYAIYLAIKNTNKALKIRTDSKYSINCLTNWYKTWEKNGWVNSNKKPIKNKKLIKMILKVMINRKITFEYVKGHSGVIGNDEADKLAKRGARNEEESDGNK